MNRSELINAVAEKTGQTKVAVGEALAAILDEVQRAVKDHQSVQLVGFGTFSAMKREARTTRNPRTGEQINVPARVVPKFVPGRTFKDAVNTKKK